MTEENKINILNYMVGNCEPTSSSSQEVFLEQEEVLRNKWTDFLPSSYTNFRFQGMIGSEETYSSFGVLYGGYTDSNNNVCGIIVLVDQNFFPVKTIYNFNSGTKLRYIQCMKQAEDGTFYIIDDTANIQNQTQQVMTSQKRFLLLNNFTLQNNSGEYIVVLRKSYILSGNYTNFICKDMYKDANSSHYIFFGTAVTQGSGGYYNSFTQKIFGLKINVGSSNEWKMYENTLGRIYGGSFATFNSDGNVQFRCLFVANKTSNRNISCLQKSYTGNPAVVQIATFSYQPYIDTNYLRSQCVFLGYDQVYFAQNNQAWGTDTPNSKYLGLYKYNFNDQQLTTIYEKYLGEFIFSNEEELYITNCDDDIYVQYNNNIDGVGTSMTADYYFQRLTNDLWNPILVASQKKYGVNLRTLSVRKNYNLLQVSLYSVDTRTSVWFQYSIKEDYNKLNYNSEPYVDYSSTVATKGRLYSDNKLVFARNLYNKTTYNNITTSTVQIPNGYLNDMTIQPKNLLSYTNNNIVIDTEELSKNRYESVLLNFINTLNVIDEDTSNIYPESANYINENINTGTQTNYENTSMTKIRINFADGSVVQPIEWEDISEEGLIAKQTIFSVYVSSELLSIDFINENEDFIYITKDYDFEVGNIYTVTQKVRIE